MPRPDPRSTRRLVRAAPGRHAGWHRTAPRRKYRAGHRHTEPSGSVYTPVWTGVQVRSPIRRVVRGKGRTGASPGHEPRTSWSEVGDRQAPVKDHEGAAGSCSPFERAKCRAGGRDQAASASTPIPVSTSTRPCASVSISRQCETKLGAADEALLTVHGALAAGAHRAAVEVMDAHAQDAFSAALPAAATPNSKTGWRRASWTNSLSGASLRTGK